MEVEAITDAVVSHAAASGWFDKVNSYEPKSAPGQGLTAAVWVQSVVPMPQASGLNRSSGRVLFNVRLYSNMISDVPDMIDPQLLQAVDALMTAYHEDFTLDGLVKNVDLLGMYGIALTAQAGYVQIDTTMYRIVTVELPLIVNDLWEQKP